MVLTLWVALLGATAAGGGNLVVTETLTPPSMVGLGARLTQNVTQEAQQQRRKVIDPSRLRATLGPAALESLRECELSVPCAAAILRATNAQRAVLSQLDRDAENYLVRLVLIDLASGDVVTEVRRSVPIASRRLASDVRAALPGFLRGEREAEGVLSLASNIPGVTITVDDREVGTAPLELELPPGRYRITARAQGHYPVERVVDVEAGGTHAETLRMTALAEADRDTSEEEAAQRENQAQLAQKHSNQRLEVAAVLAGAAVISLSAGTGMHLGFESSRRQRVAAPELQRARNVSLGVGAGLAVGAGLLWLWNATSNEDAPAVTVAPSIDGQQVGVGFSGRF